MKLLERLILLSIVEALGTRKASNWGTPPHRPCSPSLLRWSRKPPNRTIAMDISKAFDTVSHSLLIEMIHPRQEGVVPLPTTPLAFPPGAGGGPTGVRHLPSPLKPFGVRLPNPWRPTPTTSRCWLLLLASWRPRRGPTNYAPYWWGGPMASNWPLLPRNLARPSSLPTSSSPDSTLKCESATRWLRWTEPL